jgi:phytoene synthase
MPRRLWVATVTDDATAVATPAVAADVSSGAPAGSLEYFAVLFASAARRSDLRALYAFAAEIRRCSILTNHDIAHTRLQWWRQELDRCFAGDAQHPLTRTLQTLRSVIDPSDLTLLGELTVAADLDLAAFEYATWSQLAAYCFRAAGALQTVIAAVLASPDPLSERERTFARRLGAAVRQVEMLRDIARDSSSGRCYVPLEALAGHGLSVAQWFTGSEPGARAASLADWQSRLTAELHAAGSELTSIERARQRHGLVLRALHLRLLDAIRARADENIAVDVPGWGKLWTAWRSAVSAAASDR